MLEHQSISIQFVASTQWKRPGAEAGRGRTVSTVVTVTGVVQMLSCVLAVAVKCLPTGSWRVRVPSVSPAENCIARDVIMCDEMPPLNALQMSAFH